MPEQEFEIQPLFGSQNYSKALNKHLEATRKLLRKILPKDVFKMKREDAIDWMGSHLPLVKWEGPIQPPDVLTIYLFCCPPQTLRADSLFVELLKKWLIPEKQIEVLGVRNMSFYLKGISTRLFHLVQVDILVEKGRDYLDIQTNLPLLTKELSLSLSSSKYAEYTLNNKVLSYEQKSIIVHQELRQLFHRYSAHFDQEIFHDMSRLLALSSMDFRSIRPARQITRLVSSHYLMRKQLLRALNKFPEKRHLIMRFMPTQLKFPFGNKSVLGLVIAIGFIDKYENFDEAHIELAVQKFIPDAQIVKGSFCLLRGAQDPVQGVYVELEKKNGALFSLADVHLLKAELDSELKKRIEKLIPSVFMIRNEEETMRNILLLSQELRELNDLPQVMISFDKQTTTELSFTILLVRLLKKGELSLKERFGQLTTPFQFSSDRVQNVGYLQKNIPKEANVFHLTIPKERSLLRADSSVNFYLARQQVVALLSKAVGEVRDYNGGMILKQGELYSQFKHAFQDTAHKNEELLENFFFGLSPIEMQATLPPRSLELLFKLFLKAIHAELVKKEDYFLETIKDGELTFAAVSTRDPSIEEDFNRELLLIDHFSKSIVKTKVVYQGLTIFGYIFENSDVNKQKEFKSALDHSIQKWAERLRRQQELHLSFIDLPTSLDPRQGGDDLSETLLKMLFDGLTRVVHGNKATLSIAKSVEITSDLKRYTFHLRTCHWSNGAQVVAHDFEHSWKKVLSPRFETPFAYVFYPIKNARLAKEGKISSEQVGVRAVDDNTLVVDLEHPTHEFLELTAHVLYSPVNHLVDRVHPNWAQGGGVDLCVSNGPFKLKKAFASGGYELVKNPHYWEKEKVQIERIQITKDNSVVAHEMYKNGETDWLGRPLRPWESYFSRGLDEIIRGTPIGIHWCVFNAQRFPFHHAKIRQAFTLAVNRTKAHQITQGGMPATSPLPLAHTQHFDTSLLEGDPKRALEVFEEALKELGLSRKDFPVVTIIYTDLKVREALAQYLQKQFQEVLGIACRIEAYEFRQLFPKMTKGEYQLGLMSWKSWINDPIYTLNSFKYRNNTVNFSKWEHTEYQKLLDAAQGEINPTRRLEYIKEAERLLINEMPVIPLYYEVYNYMQKDYLKGVLHTDMGNIDFKWASIVRES